MAPTARLDGAAARCASSWCAPLIIALVILAAVGIGTRALCIQVDRTVRERTTAALDDTVASIDARLDAIATLLAALSAFEAGSEEITDAEFAAFLEVASRGEPLPVTFPGLGGVFVVETVDDVPWQVRRVADAPGWPPGAAEALEGCLACMTPLDGAAPAAGEIVSSAELPSDAVERLGGQVLVIDGFHRHAPAGSTGDPDRCNGGAVAVLDVDGLLGDVSQQPLPGPIGVDVDGTPLRAPAVDVTLHDRPLDVFGTPWTLRLPEAAALRTTSERLLPLLFLGMGIVLAAAVGWLAWSLAGSRSRALNAVADATAELTDANARLTASNAQLQAANEELEAFSGVVAHDLKSPLTSIRGLAEVVRDGRADETQTTEMLDRVLANVDRLTTLIDGLLEYAAAGRTIGDPRAVALGPVVAQALDGLEARINTRDANVEVGALPTVLGDAGRLTEVIENLVSNAIVHAPMGRQPRIVIEGRRLGEVVEVTVTDNGDGIPTEERATVVRAFHRGASTPAGTGTGLGISTVLRIVTAHGGTLALGDAPAGGLRVRITLPAADA